MASKQTSIAASGTPEEETLVAEAEATDKIRLRAGRLMLSSVFLKLDAADQDLLNRGLQLVTGVPFELLLPRK